jgi:hypothetical protein
MVKQKTKVAVGVGAAAAAIAAAAAGVYLFTGKRGAKNRAKVSKWADTAKKDVVKQLKSAGHVTQQSYAEIVDGALARYKKLKNVNPSELLALANELKGHWDVISQEAQTAAKKIAPVRVTVKKAVKKALAKVTPARKAAPAKKAPAKKSNGKKVSRK